MHGGPLRHRRRLHPMLGDPARVRPGPPRTEDPHLRALQAGCRIGMQVEHRRRCIGSAAGPAAGARAAPHHALVLGVAPVGGHTGAGGSAAAPASVFPEGPRRAAEARRPPCQRGKCADVRPRCATAAPWAVVSTADCRSAAGWDPSHRAGDTTLKREGSALPSPVPPPAQLVRRRPRRRRCRLAWAAIRSARCGLLRPETTGQRIGFVCGMVVDRALTAAPAAPAPAAPAAAACRRPRRRRRAPRRRPRPPPAAPRRRRAPRAACAAGRRRCSARRRR